MSSVEMPQMCALSIGIASLSRLSRHSRARVSRLSPSARVESRARRGPAARVSQSAQVWTVERAHPHPVSSVPPGRSSISSRLSRAPGCEETCVCRAGRAPPPVSLTLCRLCRAPGGVARPVLSLPSHSALSQDSTKIHLLLPHTTQQFIESFIIQHTRRATRRPYRRTDSQRTRTRLETLTRHLYDFTYSTLP